MSHDRDRLQRKLAELQAELDELTNVEPQFRQRLENTLQELRDAMAESATPEGGSEQDPGVVQRLAESARHFEETHPNLSGMIGSVIDALGRMRGSNETYELLSGRHSAVGGETASVFGVVEGG